MGEVTHKQAPPGLRQSMVGLHLWAGLLAGWLLYAIFITGGISFFREELNQWMRPEIPARPTVLDQTVAVQHALATLTRQAAGASQWQIDLPGARNNVIEAAWETPHGRQRALLDPRTGDMLTPRDTQAGEFFYYFHFSLHYLPRTLARWIVGLCAMMALVVLISGVIVHRRIFSDFFTFRPAKGQRSWLDAHNASGVLALPFHLMIVYTGLVTLMFTYMPWGALAAFGTEQARPALAQAMQPRFDTPAHTGMAAALTDLRPLMAQADARWGASHIGRIIVTQPGDAAARIILARVDSDRLSVTPIAMAFDGISGKLLATRNSDSTSPALSAWGVTYALHLGRYADTFLRSLYFLSSLLGAAMVATGMLLWVAKRRKKSAANTIPLGTRLMEKGNVAAIAGLVMAVPGLLLANRLLPLELPQRAAWEVHCFFIVWGAALLHAACRPTAAAWREQWQAGAVLWLALPVVNTVMTTRGFWQRWQTGDVLFAGFDAAFIAAGLLSMWLTTKKRGS